LGASFLLADPGFCWQTVDWLSRYFTSSGEYPGFKRLCDVEAGFCAQSENFRLECGNFTAQLRSQEDAQNSDHGKTRLDGEFSTFMLINDYYVGSFMSVARAMASASPSCKCNLRMLRR